jgi:large subunit ribosomal protein L25
LELLQLNATIRTSVGNGPARVLRRQGQMPAVLYGPGKEPLALTINTHEFVLALKGGKAMQTMFSLAIQDGETPNRSAMVKEVQTHPVSGKLMHVDFYEIAMDRKIWVNVPVVTTGKAPGVEAGGMLQVIRRELEVLCLPLEVPEVIEIDISALDIGDSIHLDEVALPANIEVPDDVNYTVLTILSPMAEEEVEEAEEAVEGETETEEADGGAGTEQET